MLGNHRKTIGIFAENTANEFQHKMCDGIIREARERGYNVAIFSSYGSYGQSKLFCVGDMQLYQLPPYEDLDGVILVLDTMDNEENMAKVIEVVKSRCTCPIVSMRMTIPGVNNILVDNSTCMESIIRHFIEFHKLKRICFMSGPAHHFDAVERLNSFQRLMEEYQLPVDDHQIFYGDFWKHRGKAACDWFFDSPEKPEAIICANDYMAVAVASELASRGIRVPDDILVSGYDGLDSSISFSPSITTAVAPFQEMGRNAVALIDEQQTKKMVPQNRFLQSTLRLGESCGCIKRYNSDLIFARANQYESLERNNHRAILFSFMSTRLGETQTMEGISDLLPDYLHAIENLHSYAICLNQNMDRDHKLLHYTDTMEVRAIYKNGGSPGHVRIPFDRKELLPPQLTGPEPQIWYFVPLHFLDYGLGYEALQFNDEHPAGIVNFQCNVILSNKIYETLTYAKMEKMIEELEQTSFQDALTGLYNRGGFAKFAERLFQSSCDTRKPVFAAVIDMDNLKKINDTYGHIEGDFAIKRVANAISNRCSDHFIYARTGGDEFFAVSQNISEEEGARLLEQIEEDLVAFNETSTKPYAIHVSSGYHLEIPGSEDTLSDFVKVADSFMYHNKIENKRKRGESLR